MKAVLRLAMIAVGAAAAATPVKADEAIKIGVLTDLSGLYAAPTGPGSVFAARQAVADFVASHKGLKVEVVAGDHQNKPDIGAGIANRWIDAEKVDAIVDVPTSSVAFVVNDIVKGKVVGRVRHPLATNDFSSFLMQAQASKAKIVALANAGGDTVNAIKQAAEFGIVRGGQKLAGMLVNISDIDALGLKTAQGLMLTEPWYWDASDANRAFAKTFAAANGGRHPTMIHAGVYAAVTHYLKAVVALNGAADGKAVVAKMKELPTDDPLFGTGSISRDGRKIHDMYLFEVKRPEESKYPWDYYKVRTTIPAAEAFRPLSQGGCPLVSG